MTYYNSPDLQTNFLSGSLPSGLALGSILCGKKCTKVNKKGKTKATVNDITHSIETYVKTKLFSTSDTTGLMSISVNNARKCLTVKANVFEKLKQILVEIKSSIEHF